MNPFELFQSRRCIRSYTGAPVSDGELQEILQAELDSVEQNLMVLRQQGKNVSRRMMTGCLKRQANLQAKLQKVQHALDNRRDDSVDFRRMGIDHDDTAGTHRFRYCPHYSTIPVCHGKTSCQHKGR